MDITSLASGLLNEVLISVFCEEMAGQADGVVLSFFYHQGCFEMAQSMLELQRDMKVTSFREEVEKALLFVEREKQALLKFEEFLSNQLNNPQ